MMIPKDALYVLLPAACVLQRELDGVTGFPALLSYNWEL